MNIIEEIPFSRADVDASWLTQALASGGLLPKGEVSNFTHTIIGEETGFLGEVAILEIDYSESSVSAPDSVVLKIPSALKNRVFGQMLGVYEKEIRFYNDLASDLNIRTPHHYYSALSQVEDPYKTLETLKLLNRLPNLVVTVIGVIFGFFVRFMPRRYVLLIENLKGYRLGDQASHCSADDVRVVLDTMARLHAQFWDSDRLDELPWITPVGSSSKLVQSGYIQSVNKFVKANRSALTDRQLEMIQWVTDHGLQLLEVQDMLPRTLLHGDFRLDNICFDDGAREVILFDWQTMQTGSCGVDLAYFLSAACPLGCSEEVVDAHIEYYRGKLCENGIDISQDQLRLQYELGMLKVLQTVIPLLFQGQIELGSSRGPALMKAWVDKTFERLEVVDFNTVLEFAPTPQTLDP